MDIDMFEETGEVAAGGGTGAMDTLLRVVAEQRAPLVELELERLKRRQVEAMRRGLEVIQAFRTSDPCGAGWVWLGLVGVGGSRGQTQPSRTPIVPALPRTQTSRVRAGRAPPLTAAFQPGDTLGTGGKDGGGGGAVQGDG